MPKVTLITHTPEPEMTIASAARLCYSPATIAEVQEKLTPEKAGEFVEMLAGLGHQSPVEHAVFTFGIEGVSRALLAQITRHPRYRRQKRNLSWQCRKASPITKKSPSF